MRQSSCLPRPALASTYAWGDKNPKDNLDAAPVSGTAMMRDHKLSGLSNGYRFPVLEVRSIEQKCCGAALALEVQGRVLLASSGFWWLLASPDGGRITTVPIDFQVTSLCISAPCLLTQTLIIWFEVTTIQCDLILDNDIGKDPISKWGCRVREPPEISLLQTREDPGS